MIKGKVFKFGDDIDTDIIVPATYLSTFDPEELAKHCMEYTNPEFYGEVKEGDIIVAGKNFGCGSSREHAPIAIKGCGVSIVIAKSFARIFYRNALNIGLYILECPDAVDGINACDTVESRSKITPGKAGEREGSCSAMPAWRRKRPASSRLRASMRAM